MLYNEEILTNPITPAKRNLAHAFKSLLRKKPFEAIRIEEICEAAGVSRRTFYNHFMDKYEILNWIIYTDFFSNLDIREDWNFWDVFYIICRFLYDDRQFYARALTEGQNSSESFLDQFLYPVKIADFRGVFQNPDEEKTWVDLINHFHYREVVKWLNSDPIISPEEFVRQFRNTVSSLSSRMAVISSRDFAEDVESYTDEFLRKDRL